MQLQLKNEQQHTAWVLEQLARPVQLCSLASNS